MASHAATIQLRGISHAHEWVARNALPYLPSASAAAPFRGARFASRRRDPLVSWRQHRHM